MNTGNHFVDAIAKMSFRGVIIDHRWLGHPLLCDKSGKKAQAGKASGFRIEAAFVLADILYFYSPRVERDPEGHTVSVTKRFDGEIMYQDYEVWAERLGYTKRELQDTLAFLKRQGLIGMEIKPVVLRNGTKTNNMPHIWPIAAKINEMTLGEPPTEMPGGASRKNVTPLTKKREAPHEKPSGPVTKKRETVTTIDINQKHQVFDNAAVAGGASVLNDMGLVPKLARARKKHGEQAYAHALAWVGLNEAKFRSRKDPAGWFVTILKEPSAFELKTAPEPSVSSEVAEFTESVPEEYRAAVGEAGRKGDSTVRKCAGVWARMNQEQREDVSNQHRRGTDFFQAIKDYYHLFSLEE